MTVPLVLKVSNLVVEYRLRNSSRKGTALVHAVNDVSLEIGAGETLAIVGESGSGKSTIAKAIMRLTDITSGTVEIDGTEVTKLRGRELRRARHKFQMIFQDPFESIDPRRTVLDTLNESLLLAGEGSTVEEREALGLQALERVGLTPTSRIGARFAHQLSGGQRQRVAIAAAMLLQPKLLVADEPVSMLDVSLRAGILRLMQKLSIESGVGCLFITHDLSLAWMYADRIAVVYLGKIVEQGNAEEVISNPRHPYTKALVSVIPAPESLSRSRTILEGESPDAAQVPSGCAFHPRCPLYREQNAPEKCRLESPVLPMANHQAACHFS